MGFFLKVAWQRAMNGQGLFLWIGDSAERSTPARR
jgi:hypothetical protein